MTEPSRLRAVASWPQHIGIMRELLDAADEVERLRSALEEIQKLTTNSPALIARQVSRVTVLALKNRSD